MNYSETIQYLFTRLPMFSRIGSAAYKKDLHNTLALCAFLGNPEQQFRSIHIAGTNGKGSTSHMLAAILQQAGYKTGLYTSPHLTDFRERIRINGEMIPEAQVVEFVQQIQSFSETLEPSFFELTVAMAFDYFAKEQVDVAVIETGLGGRLDSTNVITPILSVITNIGWDHMNLLGNTLEAIATEKAGIIKPGIPVVIGEYLPETRPVFEKKARECGAPLYFAADEYQVNRLQLQPGTLRCTVTSAAQRITENFLLDLGGAYQARNLCTVLCAEGILMELGFDIPAEAEKTALANVKRLTGLQGRWEQIASQPSVILDVGHNPDGIRQLLHHLEQIREQYTALHIITGMVKDKDVQAVLALLPREACYYFTQAQIPRALPADELMQIAASLHLAGSAYADVNAALAAARSAAASTDLILVCGSVFLVGEVNR